MKWISPRTIDFSNNNRKTAFTTELPFLPERDDNIREKIGLDMGSYLVEFNETVDVPLDLRGQILVRSSLFRSGALVTAGVLDSGYKGVIGALLQVLNPQGIILHRDARLAQIVFYQMAEKVEGYSGMYQGSTAV
jgi:dUTP pyrophosphatase